MVKVFASDVVVSPGFEGKDAVTFNEAGTVANFRIGFSVYDKRAEGNRRWENVQCKAFGETAKRVAGMKLGAKSHVTLTGNFDFDNWEKDGQKRKAPVLIIDDIEYVNNRPAGGEKTAAPAAAPAPGADAGYVAVDEDDLPFN